MQRPATRDLVSPVALNPDAIGETRPDPSGIQIKMKWVTPKLLRNTAMQLSLINPAQHKQLFLDDYAIDKTLNIKRTLHQPKKCGPVIRPDRSQGQTSLQSRSAPQWNSEKRTWEWWYWASVPVEPYGEHRDASISLTHYATSTDGVHWEVPSLELYEWRGSKDNNIAPIISGSKATCDPRTGHRNLYHIIRDERDPDPQRRYKGLFDARNRFLGVSPDGFHWTMLDAPPIPSQDESHFTYDEISEQYITMVKQPTEWGRSVWLATSKDFVTFTEPQLILHSDEIDKENRKKRVREVVETPAYITPPIVDNTDYIAEVYQMAVMPYEGIYIGFPGLFNPFGACPPPQMNYTRINQVELAVSRNLYHWERVADRAVFIGVDPWDGENYGTNQNLLTGRPHVHDNREIWIYYNALRFPASRKLYRMYNRNKELYRLDIDPELFDDSGALCLAKLRLDGFVSLDAEEVGTVTTKPFMLNGENLYVNAEAKWGEVRAEILDAETMRVQASFSTPQSIPLKGNHLSERMAWEGQPEMAFEKSVRIRFVLWQARLYAFWLGA